ncbi:hypothetical protein FJZ19_02890 [Candidatus Pacearchaeota archaeon]|nr:hypothetical protein [Candidatus Pacearchaeota archaeon]
MSLITNVQSDGNELNGDLEEKAENFRRMVAEGRKKEALAYFNQLGEKARRYIQMHEKYKWVLQSARMQF